MGKRLEKLFIQTVRDNKNQLYLLAYSYVKNMRREQIMDKRLKEIEKQ